jgi:hypothetical protein
MPTPIALSPQDILAILAQDLSQTEMDTSAIIWIGAFLEQGDSFNAGLEALRMPFPGTVVFVDLHPGTNFAHPCKIFLIAAGTHQTFMLEAALPPTWISTGIVLSRSQT